MGMRSATEESNCSFILTRAKELTVSVQARDKERMRTHNPNI